jgi:transcriptional regulator GlxA family with amidase domain
LHVKRDFRLYPDATLLDLAGATQVFAFARYRPIWLAEQKDPIRTSEGVSLTVVFAFEDHPPIDILFVPGGAPDGVKFAMFDRTYQEYLRDVAKQRDGPQLSALGRSSSPRLASWTVARLRRNGASSPTCDS